MAAARHRSRSSTSAPAIMAMMGTCDTAVCRRRKTGTPAPRGGKQPPSEVVTPHCYALPLRDRFAPVGDRGRCCGSVIHQSESIMSTSGHRGSHDRLLPGVTTAWRSSERSRLASSAPRQLQWRRRSPVLASFVAVLVTCPALLVATAAPARAVPNRAYLANRDRDVVAVLDTTTNTLVSAVVVGDQPVGGSPHPGPHPALRDQHRLGHGFGHQHGHRKGGGDDTGGPVPRRRGHNARRLPRVCDEPAIRAVPWHAGTQPDAGRCLGDPDHSPSEPARLRRAAPEAERSVLVASATAVRVTPGAGPTRQSRSHPRLRAPSPGERAYPRGLMARPVPPDPVPMFLKGRAAARHLRTTTMSRSMHTVREGGPDVAHGRGGW